VPREDAPDGKGLGLMRCLSMELPGNDPQGGKKGNRKRGNSFHALFWAYEGLDVSLYFNRKGDARGGLYRHFVHLVAISGEPQKAQTRFPSRPYPAGAGGVSRPLRTVKVPLDR
jgi:hypothetical protein